MPLDATPGGVAADSYLTVADADALAAARGLGRAATAWLAASNDDKEKALRQATTDIDTVASTAGLRYAFDQALVFPRVVDVDGLGAAYIVPNVRLATYEQAIYVLANSKLFDDAASRRARGLVSFSDDDASGTAAMRSDYGLIAPRAMAYLNTVRDTGRTTLRSVPIGSSYDRVLP